MPTPTEFKEKFEKHQQARSGYVLEGDDQVAHELFIQRRTHLRLARQNVAGVNIENVWKAADKAYVPHVLETGGGTKGFYSDDELGWRSTPVVLGSDDNWMEDSVPVNPYVKIQAALAILVDRNPDVIFKEFAKRYAKGTILHRELYKYNWDVAKSKEQLKIAVLNGNKYGVITGVTKPLKIQRTVRELQEFHPENKKKNKYEERVVTVYDDVYRWALNPWNAWYDDMARPGDPYSLNDWIYFKDFSWERFSEMFEGFENFKYVVPKAISEDIENKDPGKKRERQKQNVVRLWFYENLSRDMFFVETDDGVVLINEPLPFAAENKVLNCWVAPWTLRNDNTIYGIGTYEAMRNDYKMYIKVRGMTIDQLVQSIYKEGFFEGTNSSLTSGTGEMKTRPGRLRQVSNPKNITWNVVPPPGPDAWRGLDYIKGEIDDATGISKTLEGELSPKAKAFDIAQAREASLKRLKTPLGSISFALEQDAYITVAHFQELYSVAEVEEIVDPEQVQRFREELARGEASPKNVEEFEQEGEEGGTGLRVSRYREFPLNLDRDKEGNLTSTKEEKIFTIEPEDLPWKGKISLIGQSVIAESPLLEKQNKLELANILIPLFAQPPEVVLPTAKQLLKIYDEEPEDWFPVPWLQLMESGAMEAGGAAQAVAAQTGIPGEQAGGPQVAPGAPQTAQDVGLFVPRAQAQNREAERFIPESQTRPKQSSTVGRFLNQINPFRTPGR